jgi:hypothetical protein
LLIDRQLGVTDDVREQNMRDLQLHLFLNFCGHPLKLRENKSIHNFASGRPSRTKLALSLPELPPGITSAMLWVSNRMKGGLPPCSLLADIASMEQEIDCKMQSNSR